MNSLLLLLAEDDWQGLGQTQLVMGHLLQRSGADHLLHDWHSGDHHLGQWDLQDDRCHGLAFASSCVGWVASNKKLCKIKLAGGVHFLPLLTRYKKGRVLVVLD